MQLISAPTTSGPSVHALQLSKYLQDLGHEITIVARPGSWIAQQAADAKMKLILSHQHRFPPQEIWRLGREIRQRKIDILHTHMSRAHLMGVLLRFGCGVPCIATAHCQKMQVHWPLNNFVIATSRSTERFQRFLNLVPRSKIETIYCPLPHSPQAYRLQDLQIIRRQFGDRDPNHPQKLIGVVGEISRAKGHRHLLDAFQKIARQRSDVRLVVVGNNRQSYVEYLRRLSAKQGIAERIHWAGYRGDIPAVMQALDLYVCPSLRESLPLTLIEAMSAAKPVIATAVGGIPEIVRHQATGLLIRPAHVTQLSDSITQLLDDPNLCHRLGQAAFQEINRQFDIASQMGKIEQVYFRLCQHQTLPVPERHHANNRLKPTPEMAINFLAKPNESPKQKAA